VVSVDCFDAEPAQKWGTDIRRARSDYRCCACRETIRRGDRYARQYVLFEGKYQNWKRCLRCEAIYQWLVENNPDSDSGVDERLNCGHTFEDIHGEPPPLELARLAFMTADEAQVITFDHGLVHWGRLEVAAQEPGS